MNKGLICVLDLVLIKGNKLWNQRNLIMNIYFDYLLGHNKEIILLLFFFVPQSKDCNSIFSIILKVDDGFCSLLCLVRNTTVNISEPRKPTFLSIK